MMVGSLGDVVFEVTMDTVQTIKNFSMNIAVNYSVHKMHGRKGLLEYTGQDPDEVEFEADVSAHMGVNPMDMLNSLRSLAESHQPVSLVLGTEVIGTSWVITDLSTSVDKFYQDGSPLSAEFKVKIQEYPEE